MNITNLFPVDYRVYIAGILVPSMRAGITSAFNTPPTATITLPPYAELFGIGRNDRLPVQIFLRESWTEDAQFILLFEGEVTSFSYSSSTMGREINVNCQSLLAILRDVNIRIMTSLEDMVRNTVVKGESNNQRQTVSPGIVFPMSLFMQGLGEVSDSDMIRTPSEYLKNAYSFLQIPDSPIEKLNDSVLAQFYAGYARRMRLMDRCVELPFFDDEGEVWATEPDKAGAFPLIDGIQKKAAMQQLQSLSSASMGMQQGPTQGSVYDLLNYVVSQMEYEFAFICSPRYDEEEDKLVNTCLKPILYESFPPACNMVYRPMVQQLSTSEEVYQVPTRVRISDNKGPTAILGQRSNGLLASWGIIDYYPTEEWKDTDPDHDDTANWFAMERLADEQFTGTYTFDTQAPSWLSYVTPESAGIDTGKEFKTRIMKHLLTLKRYEVRRLQVQSALNPYITPGFPGAVFDSDDQEFTFVGHVLTVNHELSKQNCRTSFTMGFVRMVEEAIDPAHKLENTVPKIDEVTLDLNKMIQVYQKVLGSVAIPFEEVQDRARSELYADYQTDITKAYALNWRSIITFDQYLEFMGLEVGDSEINDNGEVVPTRLDGDFVEQRRDDTPAEELLTQWTDRHPDEDGSDPAQYMSSLSGIRWKLKAMADREFKNKIYT